jgi:hypothetical protein
MAPSAGRKPEGRRKSFGWREVETAEAATADLDPPPQGGVMRLFNPDPPPQWRRERNVVFEIDELSLPAAPDNPWPDLPADPPAETEDPVTLWRGWERRERLAREQRGD